MTKPENCGEMLVDHEDPGSPLKCMLDDGHEGCHEHWCRRDGLDIEVRWQKEPSGVIRSTHRYGFCNEPLATEVNK